VRFVPVPAFGDVKGVLTMRGNRIIVASVVLSLLHLASALAGIEQLKFRPAAAAAAAEARLGRKVNIACTPQPATASVKVRVGGPATLPTFPVGTTVGFRYMKGETIDRGGVAQAVTVPIEVEAELTSPWTPSQELEWAAPGIVQEPCKAWYYGGWPDLEVSDFIHQSGQFTIVVKNNNPLVGVAQHKARVFARRCGGQILDAFEPMLLWMTTGESAKVTSFSHTSPPQTDYFEVVLDFDRKIPESNEDNNIYSGADICGRRLPGKVPPSLP
jgi:hypothetical protein